MGTCVPIDRDWFGETADAGGGGKKCWVCKLD